MVLGRVTVGNDCGRSIGPVRVRVVEDWDTPVRRQVALVDQVDRVSMTV